MRKRENVIAIFDIGKTNKKIFLFDKNFNVAYRRSTRFEEIVDDDNYPCDDIESIEEWLKATIAELQKQDRFLIKAINFSTHGATLVYLDKEGNRITPLYNYLKPLQGVDFTSFYKKYEGVEAFSRKTASPAYGMLNAGLQIHWLKNHKHHFWAKVTAILHYPQYLSYLFSGEIKADFTSIGAHTALWNFDNMKYHSWLQKERINLPEPTNGKKATITEINGQKIAIGTGLHDSSASIIPLLESTKNRNRKFVLLSTGTWIICMNPFSKETLTQEQLKNNCLCFMTPDKKQVKSSMQFLGRIHEVYVKALSNYFGVAIDTHLNLDIYDPLCSELIDKNARIFLAKGKDTDFEAHPELLKKFTSYETAYYQLVYEISKKVIAGIDFISDKNTVISDIYISGGFNRNKIFVKFLMLLKRNTNIKISDCKNESALGAALLMAEYI